MISGEILEQAVSMVKVVWQKRGATITRKEYSRLLAAAAPRKTIKVASDASSK